MDIYQNWSSALAHSVTQLVEKLAQSLPNIVGAILLLIAGWLAAKILRAITIKLANLGDQLLDRYRKKSGITQDRLSVTYKQVAGAVIYWVVILVFITAATDVLDLKIFSDWLNQVISYVPTLLAGALIILVGIILSRVVHDIILAALPHKREDQRILFARIAYIAILFTAIVIGADQIGINITFLVILLSVISGAFLGGLALAVSLGAKNMISNIVGIHYFKQTYRIGDRVQIGDYQGKIIDLTLTSIMLDTDQGVVSLPAKLFGEQPVVTLQEPANEK
ncbi:MAG: mechanosensitive ion channel [Gammaproteobacteria bacterium]|jgi:small-conductance mechanosensitive channel